jgi:uncharacterized protein HemX
MNFKETETAAETETEAEALREAETEAETEGTNADAHGRIAVLERKANQYSHVIAMLQNKVTQLSTEFGVLWLKFQDFDLLQRNLNTF